jgi:KaiC/GvpD/RAD55 family RecA-like ATPase
MISNTQVIDFPTGSNIMILGPPLIGKSKFARMIFREEIKKGSGGIYVTTKDTPEELMEWFGDIEFKIIDCVTKIAIPDVQDTDSIKRVSSPIDLTGISVGINKFLEGYIRGGKENVIVVFDSLSNLLMYSNLQTVFRFLHVLTTRIKTSKAKAMYIVEQGMHDDMTITTLKQIFNGFIEFKEENDKIYLRFTTPKMRNGWKEFFLDDKGGD